ncbi:MAG: hypothetical protein KF893_19735 [Caldilineaceae bacterium]|nr:hypothetical protein [Caldilineaceae bacterium]
MSQDFWIGFGVGVFFCMIAAWFVVNIQRYRRPANAYDKPQFIMQTTSKSPREVYGDAVSAKARMGCLWILFFVYGIGIAAIFIEEFRQVVMVVLSSALNLL